MKWQNDVVEFLNGKGIKANASGPIMVAVNRDSMCQSQFSKGGCPEEGTYPAVMDAIKAEFNSEDVYLVWAHKSDDDLFIENLKGGI